MQYFLQASVAMAILYVPFILWFRKETFFKYNRGYLLAALVVSLLAPFAPDWIPAGQNPEFAGMLQPIIFSGSGSVEMPSFVVEQIGSQASLGVWDVLVRIYVGVAILLLARIGIGITSIVRLANGGRKDVVDGHVVIVSDDIKAPFSFFGWIFMPTVIYNDRDAFEPIFRHEAMHVQLRHSVDTVLAGIVCAIFWINPFAYLYKGALKAVHEYQADDIVEEKDIVEYTQLLIAQSQSGLRLALTNQFFQSQLKSRIMMMMKQRSNSNRKWKYLAILPLLAGMTLMFSFKAPDMTSDLVAENTAVGNPDEMPMFPGCKDAACSNQKLVEYISNNLKYPVEAKEEGVEGKVFVRFKVNAKGMLTDINVLKGIGAGCDEEAARVVESMNGMDAHWTPGMKDGKPVAVELTLPIMFALPAEKPKETAQTEVDEMPRFPGCEDKAADAKQACSTQKLLEYVANNLKYPKDAKDKKIEGVVIAQFVVEPNGLISSIQVVRGLHPSCDVEVVRVLETTNSMDEKWVPAMKDGKPVETKLTLPVSFKL